MSFITPTKSLNIINEKLNINDIKSIWVKEIGIKNKKFVSEFLINTLKINNTTKNIILKQGFEENKNEITFNCFINVLYKYINFDDMENNSKEVKNDIKMKCVIDYENLKTIINKK